MKNSLFIYRFLLIFLFSINIAYAEIRQTADLQVIKQEIFASPKETTLVIFDVDFVLITPSDEIFILSVTDDGKAFLTKTYVDLWARFSNQKVDYLQSILMTTKSWRPLTPETSKIFNQIKGKGYKLLGLTACGTGEFGKMQSMEKWRIDGLKSFGIVFDPSFINAKAGSLDHYIPNKDKFLAKLKHPCSPAAEEGIIFTCMIPKGEVLDAYLQYAKVIPKKIIFIDDKLDNLEKVAGYCEKNNIEYVGYEYTVINEQAKHLKLNLRRAKLQYKILELSQTWLSDQQADIVLKDIDN